MLSASLICSFFLLSSIPLYECTTFCLCIYQLMDTWIVSAFWVLGIILPQVFADNYLCSLMFSRLGADAQAWNCWATQ